MKFHGLFNADKRKILKWDLTGLNSEFYFFLTSFHIKIKVPSLPFYLYPLMEGDKYKCLIIIKTILLMFHYFHF